MKLQHVLLSVGVGLVLGFMGHIHTVVVSGTSMTPTYRSGEILHWTTISRLKVGEVVLFHHDGMVCVKRIAVLPGQPYKEFVYTRGSHSHPYTISAWEWDDIIPHHPSRTITHIMPPGQVWVLGDDSQPGMSLDSRTYGPVSVSEIFGKLSDQRPKKAGVYEENP